ncbi:MAG: hypothetical protein ABWY11_26945 [Umezawaea sp.]
MTSSALLAIAVLGVAACGPARARPVASTSSAVLSPVRTPDSASSSAPPSSTASSAPSSSSAAPTSSSVVAPPALPKPPTAPSQGLTGWPNASNTGVQTTDLKEVRGDQLVDADWIKKQGLPGSGSQADPFRIEKYLVAGMLHINLPESTNLVVSQSRVYGGEFHALWIEGGTVTVQDTTIAPNGKGLSGNGIMAYRDGTFLRNNISGFNIAIMVQGQGPYLIQDNFLHDTYFQSGDHTDVINMNPNASNGVVKHNYIDGIRSDGDYTHNGIGIYNDPGAGSGSNAVSRNWTIEQNYITRSNHLIFAAASPPFVVKDNVLTTEYKYAPFHNALPGNADAGGNVDQNGKAVKAQG